MIYSTAASRAKGVRGHLSSSPESKRLSISILDENIPRGISPKSHEEANLRLKLLAKLLADEIRSREKSNLAKYKSFKEMLEQSLWAKSHHNPRHSSSGDVVRACLSQIKPRGHCSSESRTNEDAQS